jgi:hypothetical protein
MPQLAVLTAPGGPIEPADVNDAFVCADAGLVSRGALVP